MASSKIALNASKERDRTQWVAVLNEEVLCSSEDDNPIFCRLRHPKSDEAAIFLFSHKNSKVHEVLKFDEPYRSWFVGNTVQRDGSMMMITSVDPIFFILPYLVKTQQADNYQMLDQLLNDENFHEAHRLCSCVKSNQLENVADVKGDDEYRGYKYNKGKTLKWLKKKVERVADHLESEKIRVSGSATASYIACNKEQSRDDYVRYAHGIISDYLPSELSEELRTSMGITEPVREKRATSNSSEEPDAKRAKHDCKGEPTEDYSIKGDNRDTKTKITTKSKLDRVDKSGMKSISSFFALKTKK